MTCKTCHGRKVVKRIVRTEALRSLVTTDQAQSMSEAVDAPCPDCTPKPFAEARDGRLIVGDVTVNYDFAEFGQRPIARERFEELAAVVNRAVEQREAKLRSACMLAAERIAREAYEYHNRPDVDQREGYGEGARAIALRIAERIRTLEPNVTDYVPAAELAAMRKHIEGTWGVLLEQLSETPDALPFALAMAKELGLKLEAPPRLVDVSHAMLFAAADIEDQARFDGGDFAKGLRAAATMLKERTKYLPPKQPPLKANDEAREAVRDFSDAVRRQHLEAIEQSVLELTSLERLVYGHGQVERVNVTIPADGALARDIIRGERVEVEVVTRLVDGVARTTRAQRDRPRP